MEQSLSPRPVYNFVPEPLERQLAPYGLGALLDVYQLGWKRGPAGDQRVSKVPVLLITLVGLAITVVSVAIIVNAIQNGVFFFRIILAVPTLSGLIAVVSFLQLFKSSVCIAAFSEGLVCAKGSRVTVLHWSEIEACEWKTKESSYYPTSDAYTIRARDGRVLKFKTPQRVLNSIREIICERINA